MDLNRVLRIARMSWRARRYVGTDRHRNLQDGIKGKIYHYNLLNSRRPRPIINY